MNISRFFKDNVRVCDTNVSCLCLLRINLKISQHERGRTERIKYEENDFENAKRNRLDVL